MSAGGCPALPELRGIRRGGHLGVAYDRAVDSPLIIRPARVRDVRGWDDLQASACGCMA